MKKDYMLKSNAELRIKLKEYESEFEALKNEINLKFDRMEVLDKKYLEVKEVLDSRVKNMI